MCARAALPAQSSRCSGLSNAHRPQVWVSQDELERIANHLNMSANKFISTFCKSYGRAEGWRMLKNRIDDDVRARSLIVSSSAVNGATHVTWRAPVLSPTAVNPHACRPGNSRVVPVIHCDKHPRIPPG